MNKISAVVLMLTISCSTAEKANIKSAWVDLKAADESLCQNWPLTDRDLETQSIQPIQAAALFAGFATDVKLRTGGYTRAFYPADKTIKLELDNAVELPMGQSSVLLAGWVVGGRSIIITSTTSGNRSTLEARSVVDNKIIAKSAFVVDGNIREADVAIDGDEMWLSLRTGDYSTSFARLKMQAGSAQFEKIGLPSESRGAVVVVDREKHVPYLVENLPNSDRIVLKLTAFRGKEFLLGQAQQIQLEAKGGVESWSVASGFGGVFLAAVTGDSMVGQGSLVLGLIETQGSSLNWVWNQKVTLLDIHVSEPVWTTTATGGVVNLMKWLEGESTLGVYEVSKVGFKARRDRGVYPKGSVVLSSFSPDSDSLGVIVRHKKEDLWVHSICKSQL